MLIAFSLLSEGGIMGRRKSIFMKNRYDKTITACFVGYIVQAIVNNFTPLLFLFFQRSYRIPL